MMTKNAKMGLVALGLALVVGVGWYAYQEQGVLEKAGTAIDDTIDDVTHPNEGPLEKAGRKVSETVEDGTE